MGVLIQARYFCKPSIRSRLACARWAREPLARVNHRFSEVRVLIFDLDGTLIDSKLDLAHAVNATLAHMKRESLSPETIYSYVGNGAPMLVRRAPPQVAAPLPPAMFSTMIGRPVNSGFRSISTAAWN